jgi:hypothetical protein
VTVLVVAAGTVLAGATVPAVTAPAAAADNTKFNAGYIISDAVFFDSSTMSAADVQAFLSEKGARCVPASDGTACLKDYRQTTTTRAADSSCPAQYTGAVNETAAQIITKVARACGINPRVLIVLLQKEQSLVTRLTAGTAAIYQKATGFGCPDTAPCDAQFYGFFNQVYSAASRFQFYADNPKSFAHQINQPTQRVWYHPNSACGYSTVLIRNQATAGLYNYTPYQPNAAALAAGYGVGDSCSAYGNRNFWAYFTDWFGNPTGVPPIGVVDAVTVSGASVTATGWAVDPDTTDPISIHMYVGSTARAFTANTSRPDVDAALGKGPNHGFSATMTVEPGTYQVCVYAINSDIGSGNTGLGCRTVQVPRAPFGALDAVTTTPSSVTASGWAMDPDTREPIPVHMYVDGASQAFTANGSRPDVDAAFGNGAAHGFTATMPAAPGSHQVCVYAIKPPPGINVSLGCRTVTVANAAPFGVIDSVTAAPGSVTASGWAIDPDTTAPIPVHMYVDGAAAAFTADVSRPDVAAAFGKGDRHGYRTTMPATRGTHTVCMYAINTDPGPNTALGCRTVTVPDSAPIGFVDTVTTGAGTVTATGWALDPDTTAPIAVHMYVDGVSAGFTADLSRPDVHQVFGLGDRHGYSATMPATRGTHTVCVYAISAGPGPNTGLGCRTVTVTA